MFDTSRRRHMRSDGLILGYGTANGRDLLILVLLFVRVICAVLEIRIGYGLRMMVHWSSGCSGRVDIARRRQRGPKSFWRYVDCVVQRWTLFWLRAKVRFAPTFLTATHNRGYYYYWYHLGPEKIPDPGRNIFWTVE